MGSPVRLKILFILLLQTTKLLVLPNSFLSPMGVSAHTSNIFTNQLPRFNIPPGNLSYFRSPYWEVLYLLKFKTLPTHSSGVTTGHRPILQRIKSYLGTSDSSNNYLYNSNPDESQTNSNTNFFLSAANGDSTEVYNLEPSTPAGGIGVTGEIGPVKKTQISQRRRSSSNDYDNGNLEESQPHPPQLLWRKFPRNSRKNWSRRQMNKRLPQPEPEPQFEFMMDDESDGFTGRKGKNRVSKQTGENLESNLLMGGLFGDPQTLGGELMAETTMNKKINRKFQTQGWK